MLGAFGSMFGVDESRYKQREFEAPRQEPRKKPTLFSIRALGGGENKAARMGAAQSGADQPNIAYPTGSPSDLGDEEAWRQAVLAEYAKLKNDGNEVGASTLAMQHPAALAAHWVGPTPNGVAMAPPPFDVSDGAVAKAPTSSFQFAPPPPPMGMVPQTPLSGLREDFKQHCAVQDAAALFGTWPADQYGSNSFGFNPAAGAAPPPQVPDRHRSSRNPPPPNAPSGVYPNGGGAQQASISMPPHTAATLGIERPPMPLQGVHPLQPQAHLTDAPAVPTVRVRNVRRRRVASFGLLGHLGDSGQQPRRLCRRGLPRRGRHLSARCALTPRRRTYLSTAARAAGAGDRRTTPRPV